MATHDFLLVNSSEIDFNNICESEAQITDKFYSKDNMENIEFIKLSDDILLYLFDTLKLIKTTWPNGETHNGLDYCGFSIIFGEELKKAKIILESWHAIFQQGDNELNLKGEFLINDECYEEIHVNKNEIIEKLSKLIDLIHKAYKEGNYILHLGI